MKALLAFTSTDTGITLGDLTIAVLRDHATNTDRIGTWDVGAVLEEQGAGLYLLDCPLVTVLTTVSVYVTATPEKTAYGLFQSYSAATDPSVPAEGTLCALADVKTALSIEDTTKDDLLDNLIAAASRWIEKHCERTLVVTQHTELFSPGTDSRVVDYISLVPREYPVVSVVSLHDSRDRSFGDDDLVDSDDYYIAHGGHSVELYSDANCTKHEFFSGRRTVRLIYIAGYSTIPSDLARAAVMLTVHLFHSADRMKQGVQTLSMGDQTITYIDQEMPKEVAAMLLPYARPWGL